MDLIRNKKGVVFTVLAIVIAVFFTLMFSSKIEKPIDYKTELIEIRIGTLNSYMISFFDYTQGVSSISGYSALRGVIDDIHARNAYNLNFENQYLYCILTGNLTLSDTCPGMINRTLPYYLDTIRDMAEQELNIYSNYIINNITVTQVTDAFSIEIIVNLSLYVIDAYANISDTRIVTGSVSIDGIQDPLYMLEGDYNQSIKRTALRKKEGDWNYTDLQQLYANHEYRSYKDGISFINRIKGNFSPNLFGIESIVNHTHPIVLADYTFNDTMIDYLYWLNVTFECRTPVEVVEIDPAIIAPAGFQLDETHRLSFNISSIDVSITNGCPP
ncbi:hypothetical protein AYK26_00105 [Euryarchaeota archaeon SM23-78]|nr:MAG: hypothetical protein AYK26_00105 [Euryarchaeota archaeon SM23-78]MBW3000520.1 hypothetical protein [Candidatus Woesearchaeota archaeon]